MFPQHTKQHIHVSPAAKRMALWIWFDDNVPKFHVHYDLRGLLSIMLL